MKKLLPKTTNNSQVYTEHRRSGFTLIELMVVVSIIAFLAVIGVAAFSNAQAQARDGRRRADVDAIAAALESNRDGINGKYLPNASAALPFSDCTTDAAAPAAIGIFNGYFNTGKRPKDPTYNSSSTCAGTENYYNVVISADGTATPPNPSFTVCAKLEGSATSGNASSYVAATLGTAGQFFCRKNQQ